MRAKRSASESRALLRVEDNNSLLNMQQRRIELGHPEGHKVA
jgi:hypothetical protein